MPGGMPGGKPPVILPLSALWAVLLPPGSLGGNIQALRPGPADALGGGETPEPPEIRWHSAGRKGGGDKGVVGLVG